MPITNWDLFNLRYERFDSVTQAVIEKENGISKRIIDVWIDSVPDKTYMDVSIGTSRVLRTPLKWGDCLFVSEPEQSFHDTSILQLLGWMFPGFAIEGDEDEDITFEFNNTIPTLHVLYAVGPAGIKKTQLGRSLCDELIFACPITHSKDITASGNYKLDKCLNPTGFPEIKDGFVIPSGRRFVLKAIAFGSAIAGSTTPTYLHLWDERLELFSPLDHTGVSVAHGKNLLAADIKFEDIVKVKDYVIPAGHKLTLNFDASHDGTNNIAAETLALFLIGLWGVSK